MKIVFIYNPKSGSSLPKKELEKKCKNANVKVEKFIAIDDGFEKEVKKYTREGYPIAVIGGDGTVSSVAGLLVNTSSVLIPLPGGTLNHFTKDLNVPQNIDEALGQINQLTPKEIDVVKVNDKWFINNSSIGLYPQSLVEREELESKIGKWPAAIISSWKALVRFKTYSVNIDNQKFKTPFIFVGNNKYNLDEGIGIKRNVLNEGILTVFVAKTKSRFELFKIAVFSLIGKEKSLYNFEEFYPEELTIKAKSKKIKISHDGEVSEFKTPVKYKVHKKSLKVLA